MNDNSAIKFKSTASFAKEMDEADELNSFRNEFSIPVKHGKPVLYFTGNSLGLQPVRARKFIDEELEKWAVLGVDGHFEGNRPWFTYHELSREGLALITGSKESEVVAMNNLTTNLHLLMVSFYRPTKERFKIIMEAGAFPSDQYVVESQLKFHGFDPDEGLVELHPREGEYALRNEDILTAIGREEGHVALVLLSGIQYYTGQLFDIPSITDAAHRAGALAGFDLAHAAGNVELNLHRDNVDFAVWCSYKYLNSGPGAVGGVFVHERHGNKPELPRFAGWWGHDQESRFDMKKGFVPMNGADGWQLSNVNIMGTCAHIASLNLFIEAGWERIQKKAVILSDYTHHLLRKIEQENQLFEIITPGETTKRGCQVSLYFKKSGREIFDFLSEEGVVADWREDQLTENSGTRAGVIRIAPVPLYNTFQDVYEFARLLKIAVDNLNE